MLVSFNILFENRTSRVQENSIGELSTMHQSACKAAIAGSDAPISPHETRPTILAVGSHRQDLIQSQNTFAQTSKRTKSRKIQVFRQTVARSKPSKHRKRNTSRAKLPGFRANKRFSQMGYLGPWYRREQHGPTALITIMQRKNTNSQIPYACDRISGLCAKIEHERPLLSHQTTR